MCHIVNTKKIDVCILTISLKASIVPLIKMYDMSDGWVSRLMWEEIG